MAFTNYHLHSVYSVLDGIIKIPDLVAWAKAVNPFGDGKAVDPLSLTLMLTEEDLEDPRVESCKNKMLEEYVW